MLADAFKRKEKRAALARQALQVKHGEALLDQQASGSATGKPRAKVDELLQG